MENEAETTFCNPSEIDKESVNCEVVTINGSEIEKHKEVHLETNEKDFTSENKTKEEEIRKTSSIVYKYDLCEFETIHHPGLKSRMTKIQGRTIEHQCEHCSEKFETRKKLKNHIYCIHTGKYKTFAKLFTEANP